MDTCNVEAFSKGLNPIQIALAVRNNNVNLLQFDIIISQTSKKSPSAIRSSVTPCVSIALPKPPTGFVFFAIYTLALEWIFGVKSYKIGKFVKLILIMNTRQTSTFTLHIDLRLIQHILNNILLTESVFKSFTKFGSILCCIVRAIYLLCNALYA